VYGDGSAACEITIQMPAKSKTAAETRKLDGHHTQDNRTIMVLDHEGSAYAVLCAPGVTRRKALEHVATWRKKQAEPLANVGDDGDNDGFGNEE
jgi:hypothetical protein